MTDVIGVSGAIQPEGLGSLAEAYGDRVRSTGDAYEVAVLLEAEGIDDSVAASVYGSPDVFDLARRLRDTVGTAQPGPPARRKDWYAPPQISAVRGWVFTVAGLTTMTAAGMGAGTGAVTAVLVTNIVCIAALQGVAFLSYLVIERAGASAGASSLRPFLGLFAVPAVAALLVGVLVGPWTGLLVLGAAGSITAIVLLLVLQQPLLVASVVLPVGVLAVLSALELPWPPGDVVVTAWVAGTLVLAACCIVITRPEGLRPPVQLRRVDLVASVPYVAAGLGVGTGVLAGVRISSHLPVLSTGGSRNWLIAAIPFLVPVSFAEMLVVAVRRSLHMETAVTADPASFRRRATLLTLRLWVVFGCLVLVSASAAWLMLPHRSAEGTLTVLATFGLLAALLTAGLLLVSLDHLAAVIVLLWVATVALAALRVVMVPTDESALIGVAVLAVAVLVGAGVGVRAQGRISSYR